MHRGLPHAGAHDDQRVRAGRHPRESLIYEKQDLLAPLLPSMELPPHPMRLGDSEKDYYRGTFNRTDEGDAE